MISTETTLFTGTHSSWSPDRRYRYFLRRPWQQQLDLGFAQLEQSDPNRPPIAFLLLNPSTADEVKDDPTVARCRRFAVAWGYGEVIVLNAFAYRATDPRDMRSQLDPSGPDNDATIAQTVPEVLRLGGRVVCGWGNHGSHKERSVQLRHVLEPFGNPHCFPKTKSGEPGHPLYLKNSVELERLFD